MLRFTTKLGTAPESSNKHNPRHHVIRVGSTEESKLKYDIKVGDFRGYPAGTIIPAGTSLSEIIAKEFPEWKTVKVISSYPDAGTATFEDGTTEKELVIGETVKIVATAKEGYEFTSWDDGNTDNPRDYVVGDDYVVLAYFEEITYTITATQGEGGKGTSGRYTVKQGKDFECTYTPNEGRQVDYLKIDGVKTSPTSEGTYTFTNVQSNHTFEAHYTAKEYKIHLSGDGHATLTPSEGTYTISYGDSFSATMSEYSSWGYPSWDLDGTQVSRDKSVTITADDLGEETDHELYGNIGFVTYDVKVYKDPDNDAIHNYINGIEQKQVAVDEGSSVNIGTSVDDDSGLTFDHWNRLIWQGTTSEQWVSYTTDPNFSVTVADNYSTFTAVYTEHTSSKIYRMYDSETSTVWVSNNQYEDYDEVSQVLENMPNNLGEITCKLTDGTLVLPDDSKNLFLSGGVPDSGNYLTIDFDMEDLVWDNVTSVRAMFNGAKFARAVSFENCNTRNITNMNGMFAGATLDYFYTSEDDFTNVLTADSLFFGASLSGNFDISHMALPKCTSMHIAFAKTVTDTLNLESLCSPLENSNYMFWYSDAVIINISKLDVSNITTTENVKGMFNECASLQHIYTNSNFKFDDSLSSEVIFKDDSRLHNYTPYDITVARAIVDDGTNGGYLETKE